MPQLSKFWSRKPQVQSNDETHLGDLELGRTKHVYPSQSYHHSPPPSHDPYYYLPATTSQPPFLYSRHLAERRSSLLELEISDSPPEPVEDLLPEKFQPPTPTTRLGSEQRSALAYNGSTRVLTVPRTSRSDSEISQPEIPVSPERYQDALEKIEANSPQSKAFSIRTQETKDEFTDKTFASVLGRRSEIDEGTSKGRNGDEELFENLEDYERAEDSDQHFEMTHSNGPALPAAIFIRTPSVTSLSRFAWNPSQSDEESEEPSSSDGNPQELVARAPSVPSSVSEIAEDYAYISQSSSGMTSRDPTIPYIDIEIPAGHLDIRSSSDFTSSSIARYSGIISDGRSSRPMSRAELEETVLSLGEIVRTGMRSESPSEASYSIEDGDHAPRGRGESLSILDPGSSQTSSSLATNRSAGVGAIRRGRRGLLKDSSSSSRIRSPTPPLLFGRRKLIAVGQANASLKPTLDRANSRLGKAMKENGVKDESRLGRAYPIGSGEQDWETVSEMKDIESWTGSSLADNSDSGNLSVAKKMQSRFSGMNARRILQHPANPRHHQAYVLVKDARTGQTFSVPQNNGSSLSNKNASLDLAVTSETENNYRHPAPLSGRHINPFQSSPPLIQVTQSSPANGKDNLLPVRQKGLNCDSARSEFSDDFDLIVEKFGSQNDSNAGEDLSGGREEVTEQHQQGLISKECSPRSSAWISTVSEGDSGGSSSLPVRNGSFAKFTILGREGNLTGTPEGTGARQVGSSLADSSSPAMLSSPGQQSSQTSTPQSKLPHILSTPKASSRIAFRAQILDSEGYLESRRRRSSSESNSKVMPSPSTHKASGRLSPGLRGHKKRNTSTGLLSRQAYSALDDQDYQNDRHQANMRERKGHQVAPVEADQTSTSTSSRPILVGDVVYTDVPTPVFKHPVYGTERPWDCPQQKRGRPKARPDPFVRPIARIESPHLHRNPRPPTVAVLKRQEQISYCWLPVFCAIPPFALIFGCGYADEIMRAHTGGEFNGFTNNCKTFAIYWGIGGTFVVVLIIILAAVLGAFN